MYSAKARLQKDSDDVLIVMNYTNVKPVRRVTDFTIICKRFNKNVCTLCKLNRLQYNDFTLCEAKSLTFLRGEITCFRS